MQDLRTYFATPRGIVRAVDGVSFDLYPGEAFGIVGESGSGKSVTCRSLIGLLPSPPAHTTGAVSYDGRNLVGLSVREMQKIRGAHIAMIFQDPMSALNPVMRVGDQIMEALEAHTTMARAERRRVALELMRRVGIPLAETRMAAYPHEFSGGMRQRVLIAIALACQPKVLLADEPTTALDVTIQDQILTLLLGLRDQFGMSVVLVSHDLGVVRWFCSRVAVMYLGRIVESGPVARVFAAPRHPYTRVLRDASPVPDPTRRGALPRVAGEIPSAAAPPPGCHFHPRCPRATDRCRTEYPAWREEDGQGFACHNPLEPAA